jgi:hypothetical protein
MTLGNMCVNGVRSLAVSCSVLSADRWPDACRCRSRAVRHRGVIVVTPAEPKDKPK